MDAAKFCIQNSSHETATDQFTVRVLDSEEHEVWWTVGVIKSIMTAAADSDTPLNIWLIDPARPKQAAQIEVLQGSSRAGVRSLAAEQKKSVLVAHLNLYPEDDLKFIEEEVLSFVGDPERVSHRLRLLIQALDAAAVSPDLEDEVNEVVKASLSEDVASQALQFSYLVDIDKETSTAKMRFELKENDEVPRVLATIRLVLESCMEAGATLLSIELLDRDKSAVLAVSPVQASMKLSVVDPRCAVRVASNENIPGQSISLEDLDARWSFSYVRSSEGSKVLQLMLKAIGAIPTQEEEREFVMELNREAGRLLKDKDQVDFSFLTDIDEEHETAKIHFEVPAESKIPEVLSTIHVVLLSCMEAGAQSLAVELEQGDHSSTVVIDFVSNRSSKDWSVPNDINPSRASYHASDGTAIRVFTQMTPMELRDQFDEDGDNLLIDLGHEVLDMKFSSNVAEAERHRSYAYDTIMSLIENPKDRQIKKLRLLQLQIKRLTSLSQQLNLVEF
ncbi:hypothetical protein GUITHDRAFT_162902 [Guillardia theta CCMP2712]|uniref:Uncharacterized protein n=2 Tax=Guillardia theta TaxID=55529 RepID=L1JDT1_GUITC|nr:hypothetical protein GUITHDRAFT_162902 [Guillardia theta CCMP2712]EKX46693.1 hypothetical protein GUITHDRAFT_162902 [Guillardia theta CCMP2712]|eukprot:XP_005833673.1 hypothetical protein GUITHDRAFT_162902 [Guillardia theta CCMP2712]